MTTLEDLRPETLDDIVGQADAVKLLKGLVAQSKNGVPLPHLLLSGPFGTGKTSSVYALARAVLGENWSENFREVDTSQDRGVDLIREEVVPWLSRMPAEGSTFKLIYVSEADLLTEVAQSTLRRVMETESDLTRFIFDANTPSKIIGAIRSRCLHVRFRPLSDGEIRDLVRATARRLDRPLDDGAVEAIVRHARGQARDAVNALIGGETGSLWERFDGQVLGLFTPNGMAREGRIEAFLEYLRTEGYTEWEEVLRTMDDIIREKKLGTKVGYDHFIREAVVTAKNVKLVDLPIFQLRGFLFEVVP